MEKAGILLRPTNLSDYQSYGRLVKKYKDEGSGREKKGGRSVNMSCVWEE